jgi:Fur family ferric uptake transcriptional regulator
MDAMSDQELRNAGLKVTTPRLKVLQLLEQARDAHLSAEVIYQQLKEQGDDVGLATVYRVLTQFEAAGLIHRHQFDGGYSVYEMADGEHHDHIVCVQCGKVEEFFDAVIEARQDALAKERGFELTEHQHTIYGVCKDCKAAQS